MSSGTDNITFSAVTKLDANLNSNDQSGASKSDSVKTGSKNDSQKLKPSGEPSHDQLSNSVEIHSDYSDTNCVSEDLFVGVERRRIKRLYLGGMREGATEKLISGYMTKKGINPTFVRLIKSKRIGTVAVRVNVLNDNFERASAKDFWPRQVYARE